MSLISWYPLNGNSKDKGLYKNDLTINGGIFRDDGKIGKCGYLSTSSQTFYTTNVSIPSSNMSIACWFKPTATISETEWIICLNSNASNADVQIGFYLNSAGIAFWGSGATSSYLYNYTFEIDKWYHAIICVDDSKTYYYLNNELVGTANNGTLKQKPNLTIGARSGNAAGAGSSALYGFIGCINDVRIYDHVLSKAERDEIMKCLIVHYSLSSQFGKENLAIGTSDWSGEWIETKSGFQIIDNVCKISKNDVYPKYIMTEVSSNQKFTISVDVKADSEASHNWICDYLNQSKARVAYNSLSISFTTEWKRVSFQVTVPNDSNIKYIAFGPRTSDNSNSTYFKNLKIESGHADEIPSWAPNEEDNEYNELQLNYEFDESGYSNNGIKTNISHSSDSPVGKYSSVFNGESGIICDNNENFNALINEFTISFWIKITEELTSSQYMVNYGTGSSTNKRLHIIFTSSYILNFAFYGNDCSTNFNINNNLNKWIHIVCRFGDRNKTCLY